MVDVVDHEDDVRGLTLSSRKAGAPDRTGSVLQGSFWRVYDAGRTVGVLPGTLEGHRVVKLAASYLDSFIILQNKTNVHNQVHVTIHTAGIC